MNVGAAERRHVLAARRKGHRSQDVGFCIDDEIERHIRFEQLDRDWLFDTEKLQREFPKDENGNYYPKESKEFHDSRVQFEKDIQKDWHAYNWLKHARYHIALCIPKKQWQDKKNAENRYYRRLKKEGKEC